MSSTTQALIDVQSSQDTRGIAINQVGVSRVEIPLNILGKDGRIQSVSAEVSMTVNLPAPEKGTHMSRFIKQLTQHYKDKVFGWDWREFLTETQSLLEAQNAFIEAKFRYFVDKAAPVSGIMAPMAYDVEFKAGLKGTEYTFELGLNVIVANLCPCSKAISKYGAHNQRAAIRVNLDFDTTQDAPVLWLEDLIAQLEETGSCPVYPLLKREDEKYVTERAYENPKFVEDMIREGTEVLRNQQSVKGFAIECEAFESIHGHNAWAKHAEGSLALCH